jgi:hypothetical protein
LPAASTGESFAVGFQVLPDLDSLPVVHREQQHRGSTDRCSPGDERSFSSEMIGPTVATWMKQGHKLSGLWVKPGDVGPFVAIAEVAGQRQILRLCWTAVLARDDMLDVKANEARRRLGQTAVFARVARSAADERPQGVIHRPISSLLLQRHRPAA